MASTSAKPSVVRTPRIWVEHLILAVMLGVTAGCNASDNADLHDRIRTIKAQPAGKIPPLPVFVPYETFLYGAKNMQDPFKGFPGDIADAQLVEMPDSARPEDRDPEALEQFPLDTLKYVGQLIKDGEEWAIVTTPDAIVHRVKVGNHLGKNFGEITQIQEDKILIEETIPDELGNWIKRDAALSLME